MQENVLALIQQKMVPSAQQTTQSLEAIRMRFEELSTSPDFYIVLHGLITSAEFPDDAKKEAMLFLQNGVMGRWDQMPPEVQTGIVRFVPSLLLSVPDLCEKLVNYLIGNVVRANLGGGDEISWLVSTITEMMGGGQIKPGLILTNAVYSVIKRPTDQMYAIHVAFTQAVIPMLVAAFPTLQADPTNTKYMFHCLSRIVSMPDPKAAFAYYAQHLSCVLEALPPIITAANQILPVTLANTDEPRHATRILKFLMGSVPLLGDNIRNEAVLGMYMTAVQTALRESQQERHRALSIGILKGVVVDCKLWDLLNANAPTFVQLIAGIFMLGEDDLRNFLEDRVQFVHENHKVEVGYNDAKAKASSFLQKSAKRSSIGAVVCQYAVETIGRYQAAPGDMGVQCQVFAACQMLSAVAKYTDLSPFLAAMGVLFGSESSLVRAAAFMVFKNLDSVPFSPDLMQACFANVQLQDAVGYYAAIVMTRIINNAETKEATAAVIGESFYQVYTMFAQLVAEFREDALASGFGDVVQFFGPVIIPHAVEIYGSILQICVKEVAEDPDGFTFMTPDALRGIVDVVAAGPPEAAVGILAQIYTLTCQAYSAPNMANSTFGDELVEVLTAIVCKSPFNDGYWQFLEVVRSGTYQLDAWSTHFEQMIYCDAQFGPARGPVLEFICGLIMHTLSNVEEDDDDDLDPIGIIASALVMKMGPDTPILRQIMEFMAGRPTWYMANVFSAVIIRCPAVVIAAFDSLQGMLGMWADQSTRAYDPLVLAAAVLMAQAAADNEPVRNAFVRVAVESCQKKEAADREDMMSGEDMDDDDDILNVDCFEVGESDLTSNAIPRPQWFSDEEINGFMQTVLSWIQPGQN